MRDYLARTLARIERKLDWVLTLQGVELMDLSNISSSVQNLTTVDESAVALLNQLGDLIRQNADNPAELQALADQIDAQSGSLAAAVAANTPAATPALAPAPTPDSNA